MVRHWQRLFGGGVFLAAMLFLYAAGRVLQIFPERVPPLLIVVLQVVPPALFALAHGARRYGWRGILVFAVLCLGVGSFFESLSLRTGFPFGHYVFTGLMGPKIAGLPLLLSLAYVGVGYAAWVVAENIAGKPAPNMNWMRVALCACATMTAWDVATDPVWANIDRGWEWLDGGAYFGVPLSNFLGWMLTTGILYLLFAFWLRRHEPARLVSAGRDRTAIAMYGLVAAGNLLLALPGAVPGGLKVRFTDAAGKSWPALGIVGACIAVSVLVMLPLAALAWLRTEERSAGRRIEAPVCQAAAGTVG